MIANRSSDQSMKIMPTATGIVDWNTIAPVMLPNASASLPSLTQKNEFAFSGSSVANGARISERMIERLRATRPPSAARGRRGGPRQPSRTDRAAAG